MSCMHCLLHALWRRLRRVLSSLQRNLERELRSRYFCAIRKRITAPDVVPRSNKSTETQHKRKAPGRVPSSLFCTDVCMVSIHVDACLYVESNK